jgi:hypothetical protein
MSCHINYICRGRQLVAHSHPHILTEGYALTHIARFLRVDLQIPSKCPPDSLPNFQNPALLHLLPSASDTYWHGYRVTVFRFGIRALNLYVHLRCSEEGYPAGTTYRDVVVDCASPSGVGEEEDASMAEHACWECGWRTSDLVREKGESDRRCTTDVCPVRTNLF